MLENTVVNEVKEVAQVAEEVVEVGAPYVEEVVTNPYKAVTIAKVVGVLGVSVVVGYGMGKLLAKGKEALDNRKANKKAEESQQTESTEDETIEVVEYEISES